MAKGKPRQIVDYINIPVFGTISVDRSISGLIRDINNRGIISLNCCSGLIIDHPGDISIIRGTCNGGYLQLAYNQDLWNWLMNQSNMLISNDMSIELNLKIPSNFNALSIYNSIRIAVDGKEDELKIHKWNIVEQLLSAYINSQRR